MKDTLDLQTTQNVHINEKAKNNWFIRHLGIKKVVVKFEIEKSTRKVKTVLERNVIN